MQSLPAQFSLIDKILTENHTFGIIPHKNPDGDALGSTLALYWHLTSLGKEAEVICSTPYPESLSFLPGIKGLKNEFNPDDYELIIICDTAAPHLTGFDKDMPELFQDGRYEVVNIDHHASSSPFGKIRLICEDEPATATILYKMFRHNGWNLTPDIATCLLTGLITDTGSFQHSNTHPEGLRIAGKLLAHGADLATIKKEIFCTKPISTLKLWGRVFENLNVSEDGVVMSAITKKDLEECGAKNDELTGVIDYLNSIQKNKFSLLLSEQGDVVKGSLRTGNEATDVAEIAAKVGGGGHTKAAGFAIEGKLEQYTGWKVVKEDEKKEERVSELLGN